MSRLISIAICLLISLSAVASGERDFASKFMETCEEDTALQCVTVSPKMMEQLTKTGEGRSEHMTQAIQKLKSARIVTATSRADDYYQMAEELLKKNSQRFKRFDSYHSSHAYGSIYSRQAKNGNTVELILLHCDSSKHKLVVVNLTGDIDDEFVTCITKNLDN